VSEGLTSPPTQYRLFRDSLQVKRPNQQYQSTEGKNATKLKKNPEKANNTKYKYSKTINIHI